MALPKLDNTQLEKNQQMIIQRMDGLTNIVSNKLVTAVEKLSENSTVEKMFPFVVQIADNIYNIAGKLEAQVTSMKEVRDAIEASAPKVDEGAKIEAEREKGKEKKEQPRKEEKKLSFFERFMDIFDKVLAPLMIGAVLGIAKAFGAFETSFGKITTLLLASFTALYFGMSSFRKKVNELVVSGFKKLFGMGKPPGAPPGVPGQVPGAPGKGPAGTPVPGAPDAKGAKAGPSGLDKFLENAKKVGKSIKDLFVGIADTIKQVLGKLAEGIKQFISKVSEGIKVLLQNIAKGIESFGKASVLKGAAALLVVSGALFVAAKAFKQFADVSWEGVAKGLVAITGLVGVTKLLEKSSMSMIKGAFALGVIGAALIVAAKGFEIFTKISWEDLAKAGVAIVGLTAAVIGLGMAAPLVTAGTVALGIMSVGLVAFAGAVALLGAGLSTLTSFFQQVSALDGGQLAGAAAGITAIGLSLAALGAGQVIGALGNFATSILSFGEKDIFTKLTELGAVAKDLNQLPATIEALGKLSNFKVSGDFMKNVDTLSAGLKKIADAAKGFEKTGDSLTALAKIAEAMGKPAGGAPAGTQPGAAPGKPAAGQIQGAPQGQQPAKVFSEAEIQKQREAAAKMPEGSVARRNAEARVESMESRNKVAESFEQATPEQKRAVIEGKPVAKGQQLTTDSQKVAAAQGGGGAGSGQTNIVAPQSSVVNAPQSQTVNSPLSAFGVFGGRVSRAVSAIF